MKLTPLKSVRKFCLCCMAEQANEIKLCPSEDCDFYPIRFNKGKKGYSVLKAIKRKCRDCGEGTAQAVKSCEFPDCQVYIYRQGHNPSLKGKGSPNPFPIRHNSPKKGIPASLTPASLA